jgi:hypothetical protein
MKENKKNISIVIISLLFSILYSILRYNIFSDVSWIDLPLYVFNKGFALSSIILFAYYHSSINNPKISVNKLFREYAIILGVLHILISLIIISPEYFPKFYNSLKLNGVGELSIFFGVISSGIILYMNSKKILEESLSKTKTKERLASIFFVMLAAHVFVMGYKGWLDPGSWPGYLPPITLLSFIIAAFPLLYKNIQKNK